MNLLFDFRNNTTPIENTRLLALISINKREYTYSHSAPCFTFGKRANCVHIEKVKSSSKMMNSAEKAQQFLLYIYFFSLSH